MININILNPFYRSDAIEIDDLDENLQPARPSRARTRRPNLPTGLESRDRDFKDNGEENGKVDSSHEALMQRLRHL